MPKPDFRTDSTLPLLAAAAITSVIKVSPLSLDLGYLRSVVLMALECFRASSFLFPTETFRTLINLREAKC